MPALVLVLALALLLVLALPLPLPLLLLLAGTATWYLRWCFEKLLWYAGHADDCHELKHRCRAPGEALALRHVTLITRGLWAMGFGPYTRPTNTDCGADYASTQDLLRLRDLHARDQRCRRNSS